jgi:proline iminopeptidase
MKKIYYKLIALIVIILLIWKIYYLINYYNDEYSHTSLYPKIKPLDTYYIKVSDIHTVGFSTYGNKYGKPILVVHGGPGAAPTENSARFFDTSYYFIIIVDQRGCGKSTPSGELRENTTQHLIEDFEVIRKKLHIDKWILFGGSWGSTLSLAYSITYPNVVSGMILRGIFLSTPQEVEWIWGTNPGLKNFNHIGWDYFVNTLPKKELTGNYIVDYKNCFNGKFGDNKRDECLLSWAVYETSASKLQFKDFKNYIEIVKKSKFREFSLIENHYVLNNCFLEPGFFFKQQNINKIKHIPTIIVQGRYDLVCTPISAYTLHKMLPNSQLFLTVAGHSQYDDENINKLIEATKSFQTLKY